MFRADHNNDTPPPITPNPPSRPPAANALKHGFRASKYLDPAILECAESIRADLFTIHDPESDEETDLLEDLAIARARFDDIQRTFDSARAVDRKHARDQFQNLALKRLNSDIVNLNEFPTLFFDTLSQNFEGTRWIVGKWSEFVRSLAPDRPGITFEQAMFACYALGSHWSVSQMTGQGAWVMSRFVKDSLEPHVELHRWVQESGGPTDLSRARWYLDRAPDGATCRHELLTEAQTQLERWSLRLNDLRPDYETEAATAADRVLGDTSGGQNQPDRFRIQIRYLSEARSQVDRLHRRLDAVKKCRPMNRHRAARKAERSARQRLLESLDIPEAHAETPPPPPAPTEHESTEKILSAEIAAIFPNGLIAPDSMPAMFEPCHEPAAREELRSKAAVREGTAFECPFEIQVVAHDAEMPTTEVEDFPNAEADNAKAFFDFAFDDEAETVLDVENEARAQAEADAGEAPAIDAQDICDSADTSISSNGPAALPEQDRAMFDRVSDTRIPLGRRIAWLAERLGVHFETEPCEESVRR